MQNDNVKFKNASFQPNLSISALHHSIFKFDM